MHRLHAPTACTDCMQRLHAPTAHVGAHVPFGRGGHACPARPKSHVGAHVPFGRGG